MYSLAAYFEHTYQIDHPPLNKILSWKSQMSSTKLSHGKMEHLSGPMAHTAYSHPLECGALPRPHSAVSLSPKYMQPIFAIFLVKIFPFHNSKNEMKGPL